MLVRMGILVHRTQPVQVLHQVIPFTLNIIIPSLRHSHISFMYHQRYTTSPCFTPFLINAPVNLHHILIYALSFPFNAL